MGPGNGRVYVISFVEPTEGRSTPGAVRVAFRTTAVVFLHRRRQLSIPQYRSAGASGFGVLRILLAKRLTARSASDIRS